MTDIGYRGGVEALLDPGYGMLTISGERREDHEEDRDGVHRSERSYGQFQAAPREAEQKRKRIQVR